MLELGETDKKKEPLFVLLREVSDQAMIMHTEMSHASFFCYTVAVSIWENNVGRAMNECCFLIHVFERREMI